jgi:hypothetical protein
MPGPSSQASVKALREDAGGVVRIPARSSYKPEEPYVATMSYESIPYSQSWYQERRRDLELEKLFFLIWRPKVKSPNVK